MNVVPAAHERVAQDPLINDHGVDAEAAPLSPNLDNVVLRENIEPVAAVKQLEGRQVLGIRALELVLPASGPVNRSIDFLEDLSLDALDLSAGSNDAAGAGVCDSQGCLLELVLGVVVHAISPSEARKFRGEPQVLLFDVDIDGGVCAADCCIRSTEVDVGLGVLTRHVEAEDVGVDITISRHFVHEHFGGVVACLVATPHAQDAVFVVAEAVLRRDCHEPEVVRTARLSARWASPIIGVLARE